MKTNIHVKKGSMIDVIDNGTEIKIEAHQAISLLNDHDYD